MSDEPTTTDTTQTTEASASTEATSETVATEAVADGDAGAADASTVLGSATSDDGAGDKGGDDGASDQGAAAEAVVPETYDLKLTVAGEDGAEQEVPIDTALLEAATPTLKELGLTNEQANKVAALVPKIQERLVQQQADAFAEMATKWAKDAEADPEIGGQNWKATKSLAAKAIDTFGDKDFRAFLEDTKMGNHPGLIRFCRKVGEGVGEDGVFARGTEGPRPAPDRLKARYPTDHKE